MVSCTVTPSRLENLVKPVDAALAEHDFEPSWANDEEGARLATFGKGELVIEYVLAVNADARTPSYAQLAGVSLDVKLRDGGHEVSIYNSSISSTNTTTDAVVKNLVNGCGKESDWPDPSSPTAHMSLIGLKRRLSEVFSQIPARYIIAASEPVNIMDLTVMLQKGVINVGTRFQWVETPNKLVKGAAIVSPDYGINTGRVYMRVTPIDDRPLSYGFSYSKFEVTVSPKTHAFEGVDFHKIHLAIKETAKAVA